MRTLDQNGRPRRTTYCVSGTMSLWRRAKSLHCGKNAAASALQKNRRLSGDRHAAEMLAPIGKSEAPFLRYGRDPLAPIPRCSPPFAHRDRLAPADVRGGERSYRVQPDVVRM